MLPPRLLANCSCNDADHPWMEPKSEVVALAELHQSTLTLSKVLLRVQISQRSMVSEQLELNHVEIMSPDLQCNHCCRQCVLKLIIPTKQKQK
jgi:hypothetical protein